MNAFNFLTNSLQCPDMKTCMACSENLRVDDINLVTIFIAIKDTQVFTSEALLILTI